MGESGAGRAMVLGLLLAAPLIARAQEGARTGSGKDPEVQRLEEEKKRAELERDIARAHAEALRAELPKPGTRALEGKTTLDDKLALPSLFLAYQSASKVAERAAQDILDARKGARKFVVYSERELGAVASYTAVGAQIDALVAAYRGVPGVEPDVPRPAILPPAVLAPEVLAAVLGSAADVFALFRTDVQVEGVALAVEQRAVLADLARALRARDVTLVNPQTYFPARYLGDPFSGSAIVGKLNELQRRWSRAVEYLRRDDPKAPRDPQAAATLKALNAQAEKLTAYLVTVDEKTGLSPLVALIRAEHLKGALEGAELLAVLVDAAGGGNRATRNIWTGSKLYHTGGVAVTVMVFDAEGTIAFSKAYRCAAAYTRFEREPERFIGNVK